MNLLVVGICLDTVVSISIRTISVAVTSSSSSPRPNDRDKKGSFRLVNSCFAMLTRAALFQKIWQGSRFPSIPIDIAIPDRLLNADLHVLFHRIRDMP
ncbi:hypothetical protein EV424DRAFT_1098229 [Suillus variegatus]|nr:hypothetical protein EV424DRAFT_1098229 [Suillus variegatus]